MIVKFFGHGTSGGRGPVRYLTEQDGEPREDAVVLRGNSYMIEQQ